MRVSRFFLSTLKEAPAEAELISHRLMLRAGMIKRLAAGIYTWMPLGLRVLRKVEAVVRDEMNRAGAIELLMPVIQPAELWQESRRWDDYGPELLRIKDRHQRDFGQVSWLMQAFSVWARVQPDPEFSSLVFEIAGWIGADDSTGPQTRPEVAAMAGVPLLCIYGEGEADSICPGLSRSPEHTQIVLAEIDAESLSRGFVTRNTQHLC